jgi:D-alanyl-D-alanine carboxypeptidase
MAILDEKMVGRIVEKMVNHKYIFSAVLRVENHDGSVSLNAAAGEMSGDDRYYIASVTKLYITALVLQLMDQKKLKLGDRIGKYLPVELISGIHVFKGVDYTDEITIKHLISNTSGIPDYFFHRQPDGKTAASGLLEGKDEPWPLEKTIGLVKNLTPKFSPGQKGKADYSDTNYQLLGRIIETITGQSIHEAFSEYIFKPLGLQETYVYTDINDTSPAPVYYKSKKLLIPRYMTSVSPEGGIVSTTAESMIFLKAFFGGRFFPQAYINELKEWNFIFGPGMFYYGIGLEKLFVPRIMTPFYPPGEILGFWGQTGSFAFFNPRSGLYFSGTTNQIGGAGHQAAGKAMFRLIKHKLKR